MEFLKIMGIFLLAYGTLLVSGLVCYTGICNKSNPTKIIGSLIGVGAAGLGIYGVIRLIAFVFGG